MTGDPAACNREAWNRWSREYQDRHGAQLKEAGAAWGGWSIPESELQILGDVRGKNVLELGCGGAQWSIALARVGARPVGVDISERQLEHARRLMAEARVDFPLVHAAADDVPLPDDSFDIVFSDHGAFSWGDPYRVVPEAARLLRPGGLLAFNVTSPLARICWSEEEDGLTRELLRPYFDTHVVDEGEGAVTFDLGYGAWFRLLRRSGFDLEDLVELRPPEGASTTYDVPLDWARSWPSENVWKARKRG